MRKIYEFSLPFETEVEKTETKKDETGADIKVSKKVKEKIDRKFFLARPSRQISDDAEIFRASTESELVRRGVLRAQVAQKYLMNEGGILSDDEKKTYEDLTNKFIKLQQEYSELNSIIEKDRTDEQKKKIEDLLNELSDLMGKLNEFENASSSLYNRTAEAMARNKVCLWLALMLSHEEKDGKNVPVFEGKTYEDKLKVYDEMEEKEVDFEYELIKKLLFIISTWYMGKANTKEEFDALISLYNNQNLLGTL